MLIFDICKVAKFGAISKIIILVAAIFIWLSIHFENDYKKDVRENLQRTNALQTEMLTETDLQPLANQRVQRYLRHAGVLNNPKIKTYILFLKER